MQQHQIPPVIRAGGSGIGLWSRSRRLPEVVSRASPTARTAARVGRIAVRIPRVQYHASTRADGAAGARKRCRRLHADESLADQTVPPPLGIASLKATTAGRVACVDVVGLAGHIVYRVSKPRWHTAQAACCEPTCRASLASAHRATRRYLLKLRRHPVPALTTSRKRT